MSRLFGVILLAVLATFKTHAEDKPVFDSMDVFDLEWATSPQISPDGKQVAYLRNFMNIMNDRRDARIWLVNSDGSGHTKLTNREVRESSPVWSPDGSRISFVSSTDNGSEIYVYWVKTGKMAKLTQLERSPSGLSWSPDGEHIAFSMLVPEKPPILVKSPAKPKGAKWADKPRVTTRLKYEQDGSGYLETGFRHLFVLPADGGTARQLTRGDFHHRGPAQWSKDGKQLIFSANRQPDWEHDYRNTDIYSVSVDTREIKQLTDRQGPDHTPIISPNGKQIAYLGYPDKVQNYQVTRLYIMDLDGSNKREIDTKLDRSLSNIKWMPKGIYFQYDNHGDGKLAITTTKGKITAVAESVGDAMGRPYGGGSFSVNQQGLVAYTHATAVRPSDVAVITRAGNKPDIATQLNEDLLAHRTLGEVKEIWYKSSVDQRDIQGWYVLPPNYEKDKDYPLLVENHGGPVANYGARFSPEMQLYAAADYVVFYPNQRSSTSYGEEFGNLIYNNYPGDDYHDVMDGVDAMIQAGLAQEGNLYVTGGSAGGIMAAWMIGKNNRFRSAAVVKPVMNWISKTLVADNYYAYADYRYPGQPWENFENYWKFSPLSLVGNIQTPTLVMVGGNDMRTPLSESKQLYNALKLRKIDTALVEMPGSFHFIANRPSQLIGKIEHILAWFEKYQK